MSDRETVEPVSTDDLCDKLFEENHVLRNRLAALEQRVIVKEDVEAQGYEVPEWAEGWDKDEDGDVFWWGARGKEGPFIEDAPDLCPDLDGPVTLAVVSLRSE